MYYGKILLAIISFFVCSLGAMNEPSKKQLPE